MQLGVVLVIFIFIQIIEIQPSMLFKWYKSSYLLLIYDIDQISKYYFSVGLFFDKSFMLTNLFCNRHFATLIASSLEVNNLVK